MENSGMHNGVATLIAIGLGFVAVSLIVALVRSKSEAARRARVVISIVFMLGLTALTLGIAGPVGFAIIVSIIGAGYWIFKGRGK